MIEKTDGTRLTYREYIQNHIDELKVSVKKAEKELADDNPERVGIYLAQVQHEVTIIFANCNFVTSAMLDLDVDTQSRLQRG